MKGSAPLGCDDNPSEDGAMVEVTVVGGGLAGLDRRDGVRRSAAQP